MAALQAVLSVCAASLQIISLYTLWQLVHMHEMDGHRFNRYQELGQVRRGICFGTCSCVSGCTQVRKGARVFIALMLLLTATAMPQHMVPD